MPIHVRSQSVAPIVFLPGDPDRARWIAENVLENAEETTRYRRMYGFNGTYDGRPVTVQTTGMGGPSAAIVCEELATLGAKCLIRIGTCGAMHPSMEPGDLLLVTGACMSDGTSHEIIRAHMQGTTLPEIGFPATSDFELLCEARRVARERGIPCHVGKVASLDRFYGHPDGTYRRLFELGVYAVEMEASTVLSFAAVKNIRAAAMMTVSDQIYGAKRASEDVIAMGVRRMVDVAMRAMAAVVF